MMAAVITLVTMVTSPGMLDPVDEGTRILRNVGGGLLVTEMKALGSFETAGPGLLGMKTKALGYSKRRDQHCMT